MNIQPVLVGAGRKRILGLLVLSVHSQSAAEAAGLQVGDVLIGVSGQLFVRPTDLNKYLNLSDRTSIPLQVLRGGQQFVFYVALQDRETTVEAA